ncbi:MAG: hypothetical protein ACRCYU_09750 [Nocardioides sp.]
MVIRDLSHQQRPIVGLPYAAVLQLEPVKPDSAGGYLTEGRVGAVRNRWEQIAHHLRTDRTRVLGARSPVSKTITTRKLTGSNLAYVLAFGLVFGLLVLLSRWELQTVATKKIAPSSRGELVETAPIE